MTHGFARFPPKRILVAADHGPSSDAALAWGRLLGELCHARVLVVLGTGIPSPWYLPEAERESFSAILREGRRHAEAALSAKATAVMGRRPEVLILDLPPAEAVLETAEEEHADLLILGVRANLGSDRVWMGSTAECVLRHCSVPALAARVDGSGSPRLERLLAAADGEEPSKRALDYAGALAKEAKARLSVVRAVREAPGPAAPKAAGEAVVRVGEPAEVILREARERRPDLLVLGAQRRATVLGTFFSGAAERVLRAAEVPVLIVPKTKD